MKTNLPLWLSFTLLTTLLFSGCQPISPAQTVSAQADFAPSAAPTTQPALAKQPAVSPTAALTATQAPELTEENAAAAAAQSAEAYFTAVAAGDSGAAADLLSGFSLTAFALTRGDAVDALQAQKIAGVRWSDLKILDTQPFDQQTMLVHLTYTEAGKIQPGTTATPTQTAVKATPTVVQTSTATAAGAGNVVDALWPMRLERGAWRYNWNNLIDFHTLSADAQTMNGITILPTQITRYSDRIQLSMLVQNRTNAAVVFGQVNETLGTFHFDDQAVVAEKTRWILNPLRSVPAATLEIKGLFTRFPDTVEIRKWNNYNVKPWYVFQLQ